MDYPWYTEIENSGEITQGDILKDCIIPLPDKDLYRSIIEDQDQVKSNVDLKTIDIIILSQSCDIKNDKIESIVMCPIWELQTLVNESQYYKSSNARESLRQGKEPAYHLINDYTSDKIVFNFSVVDFHRIYSLPKDYVKTIGENAGIRLRLLSPYREHLSQAFARYFMRVGLPTDIDKERIKQIKNNI